MTPVVTKPMVAKSPLSGSYFYFTRHRRTSDKGVEVVGKKTDVTESVTSLVEEEIIDFLRYVQKTYGLDLRDPEPKTEEDGQKYIWGVKEATGYSYLNELVAEWRSS